MLCCHCGREVSEELHFCPYCGGKDPMGIYTDDPVVEVQAVQGHVTPVQTEISVNEPKEYTKGEIFETQTENLTEVSSQFEAETSEMTSAVDQIHEDEDLTAQVEDKPSENSDDFMEDESAEELPKRGKKERKAKEKKTPPEKPVKEKAPKKKSKAGVIVLAIFILAILAVGGYFAYITWFSPEARFAYAMEQGLASVSANEYADAAEHYGKAIEIDSTSAEAYIARGDTYVKLEDYSKAVDDYLKAYFISADDSILCEKLGDAYYAQGIFDNAENYFREAIELSAGKSVYAYSRLSDSYYSDGDRDEAIAILADGVKATGDAALSAKYDALLSNKYGDFIAEAASLVQAEDFNNALEAFSDAVDTNPELSEAYVGRAECYVKLGKYADACADYAAAISHGDLSSGNYLAYAEAGIALMDTSPECAGDVVNMLENGYAVTSDEEIFSLLVNVEPSVPGGNYDEPFLLELKSLCDVHYTLDGTDPDETSPVYSKPIEINTGDTQIKFIAVSSGGISGEITALNYNVTTIEMKAMASFEKYFTDHFNDSDQDIFIYDVTGDGLQDMIIVDKNPDDDKLFRVRLYVFDGTAATPIYLNSKATTDNFSLCLYDGGYCFLSHEEESATENNVRKSTETYLIFRVTETGDEQEIKKYTVKTEGNSVSSSDLDETSFKKIKIIGVPSLLIDAMGKFETLNADLAYGSKNIQFYNGRFYTVCSGFGEALANSKQLNIECNLFVIADDTVFYYAKDETSDNSLYKTALDGTGTPVRIGEGDGQTLVYSGGWIYVGNDVRYNAESGEQKTDTYVNIEKMVFMDGSYIFYQCKLADALTRADRDQFNSVDVLAKYDSEFDCFTDGGRLYLLRTDKMPQIYAYTLNGTYIYDAVINVADLTGKYLVSDGILYLMHNKGIVSINLTDGTVEREYKLDADIQKGDTPVCAGSGKLVIKSSAGDDKYMILDLGDGTTSIAEALAADAVETVQP